MELISTSSIRIVLKKPTRSWKVECSCSIINSFFTDSVALLIEIESISSPGKRTIISF